MEGCNAFGVLDVGRKFNAPISEDEIRVGDVNADIAQKRYPPLGVWSLAHDVVDEVHVTELVLQFLQVSDITDQVRFRKNVRISVRYEILITTCRLVFQDKPEGEILLEDEFLFLVDPPHELQ